LDGKVIITYFYVQMNIKTERLVLRPFNLNDSAFIIELLNSPGWIEFIGDRNVRNDQQAKEYLANGPLASYDKNGFGLSMVETLSGIPVGMCGLLKRDELDAPDLGFAFLPAYHGLGYGLEIAKATLDYARDKLILPRIMAITMPANRSSVRLLENAGLNYKNTIAFPPKNEELMLFEIVFHAI
jgi:RimJ/RimL family protein N-acetyltransferase